MQSTLVPEEFLYRLSKALAESPRETGDDLMWKTSGLG